MESQGRLPLLLLVSSILLVLVKSQDAPVFVRNMNLEKISEATLVGTIVYQLSATDPQNGPIIYDIDADMFQVDEGSGNVTLTRPVDYESQEKELKIIVYAIDQENLITSAQVSVNVLDANDNPAQFSAETYKLTLPENQPVGSIIHNLTVTDLDFINRPIQVTCNPSGTGSQALGYAEACATFQVNKITANNKEWEGNLQLIKALDFETRPTYQLSLETFDGLNRLVQSFEIILRDINDSPPEFIYTAPATVNESVPLNSNITYVIAVDGDENNPNDIRYELNCTTGNGLNLFSIDSVTGVIVNTRLLDRESVELSQGFIDLCVKAREVIRGPPDRLGNDPLTTATATIRINVRDLNDNSPTFHQSQFTVNIREDIPNESALPGLIMTVTDLDSGTANSYNFVLLDNNDVFAVFPDSGKGQTTSSVKVTDTLKIDYERGPRQYILRVEAREVLNGQISRLTGSATVTVNVLDVNDNIPQFTQADYIVTVDETANIGSIVETVSVTDPDSGTYGTQGVRFGLVGNGAEKFLINNVTGVVTIAPCLPKPGEDTCIDYEKTQRYDLTVTATDELGNGLSRTARLQINVRDINDNKPAFLFSEYAGNIFEGKTVTIDPLLATAADRDSVGGPITYSISYSTQASRLWQIDPVTANITAIQPIKYEDVPQDKEYIELSVLASDQDFTSTIPVKIYVIDRNDNPPVFVPNNYVETIDESTLGNFPVLIVTATDKDSPTTDNGKIEYGIEAGAAGKFVIDRRSGQITTASDATFDYDVQRIYEMLVLARDGGNPQLTGTASVTVNIRDANNKDPFFRPQTLRAEVFENVPIGSSVTNLVGYDRDAGSVLNYFFTEPISAINPDGIEVNRATYNYVDLFEVEATSGRVKTKSNLDRDRTSVITYTILVVDTSATPRQTGTGTLIITVLEYNDQNPYFQLPFYNITIDEEQPIGAFVMTLIAQDEDDEIAEYRIYDDRGNYFAIASTTGVLTVKNNIDYEKVQRTEFMAEATDSGFPPLKNTTRVYVNIININDNSPIFDRSDYTATIPEHSPPATSVVTVTAKDQDLEDYGVVRYKLANSETRFAINSVSGEITTTADLDREKESTIALQVTAYDSPLDPSVQREYTVPVYIYLSDINDNSPIFSNTEYEATIIETIDIGAQILQVFATDLDVGTNAIIAFSKLSGDPSAYFDVGRGSGRITVGQSLRGKAGDYVFYILAEDLNGDPLARNDSAKVTIHVIEATNSPPTWTIPPRDNMTIEVLETQYLGMLVYDVEAVDNDNGNSGIVDYGFYYQGSYTRRTPEFSINSVTGVIRAEILYDRETVDRYVLLLSARDRGDPSLEAVRFLTIVVIDVNDNVPHFPMTGDETTPYEFSVKENALPGTVIDSVHAIDRDTIDTVYYYILAGDRETFGINTSTGAIFLKKSLDRETQAVHTLDIHATNNISDFSVIRERRKRSTDPSIVTVRITVTDVEDETPVFTSFNGPNNNKEYYGCISATAPFGKSVVQAAATDADAAGPAGLQYALGGQNSGNTFAIDPSTGLIYNRLLVDQVDQNVFYLKATATDRGNLTGSADVKVFKTKEENEAKIVINQKSSEVRLFIQQLIRLLEEEKDIQYVCVTLIRDHVDGNGRIDTEKTDVYVAAAYGAGSDYRMYSTQELINIINTAREDDKSYDALYITGVGTKADARSFFVETPVLAVLIIIILLIIMALILFCLACYCISDSKKKKLRRTEAERFTVVSHEPVKEVSPVYDNRGFEREQMPLPDANPVPVHVSPSGEVYAMPQKKRPPSDEFAPVQVIPIQSAQSIIETVPPEPEEGPFPVIETEVIEDEPPVQQPYDPEPVIVTEVMSDPEPQTTYFPDPEPQTTYIPDPEPQAVYIPEPEPPHLEYTPEPEPESYPEPYPEPSTSYNPIQEEGVEEIIVEVNDDTPESTPRHSPPPSPKSSPRHSPSPSPRYSPSPSPRHSLNVSQKDEDDQMTTDMM